MQQPTVQEQIHVTLPGKEGHIGPEVNDSHHNRGILVKKVIFIEKGNIHVMPGHQEKNHVTIEIII